MWQLIAAWLCHQKGRKDERDEFVRAFGRTPQKVPYQWTLIATDLLPGCFDLLGGSWLTELAWRSLPVDSFPNFVARVAERGVEGRRVALRLVESRSENDESLLPEEAWSGRRCRCELLTAWANCGDWDSACAYALEPLRSNALDRAADRIRHLGELAKSEIRPAVLDRLTEALLAAERIHPCHDKDKESKPNADNKEDGSSEEIQTSDAGDEQKDQNLAENANATPEIAVKIKDPLKIWEIIGQLCAWQIGCIVKGGRDSLEYNLYLEDYILSLEMQAGEMRSRLKMRRQPGAITISYELAEAFSERPHFSWSGRAASFRSRAASHWEKARGTWEVFKTRRSAHTIEVFQQAMWLAHTTLILTERGVWSPKESAKKRDGWVGAIRDVLRLGDDSRRLAEMLEIPATGDRPSQLRWMEPLEWNAAIVTAIEVLVLIDGVTPAEMARTICRARSANERGRAVFRCLTAWVNKHSPETADKLVEELFDANEWNQEDIATGWALWFRLVRQKGRLDFFPFALRAIEAGTAKTGRPKSVHRAELAVEVAARHSKSERSEVLLNFAYETVSKRSKKISISHALLLWSDLAKAAATLPRGTTWRAKFVDEAMTLADRATHTPAMNLGIKIQTVINYASLAADFQDWGRAGGALKDAKEMAQEINTLSGHLGALCDIAEVDAKYDYVEQAGILFAAARDLIPGQDGGQPLGTKRNMLRPHLAACWLLGMAKALAHQSPPTGNLVPLQQWSECVLDPRRFLKDWDLINPPGKSLLDLMTRDDRDDFHRARAIAAAWRAMFSREFREKNMMWEVVRDSLKAIGSPAIEARTQRDLAMIEARADPIDPGRARHALRRARMLGKSFDKNDVLHRIGTVFAKNCIAEQGKPEAMRHQRAFLLTVPDCAESFSSTYLMLANLVRLFPEDAEKIDKVLERRGVFS